MKNICFIFFEFGGLIYMKILACCSEETQDKGFFFFSFFFRFSDMIVAKKKAPSPKRKLLENFVNCPLS